MASPESSFSPPAAPSRRRQRLARDQRNQQLISVAWGIVKAEGTEALTLGKLAERAGVTKPVVYDHFRDRNGLLAALYMEFDGRQNAVIDQAIALSQPTAQARAQIIAEAYVDCVLTQGREIGDLVAALSGTPELQRIRRDCEAPFIEKCRKALGPVSPSSDVSAVSLRAMLGAAEALSNAAAAQEMTPDAAKQELRDLILDMLARQPGAQSITLGQAHA